MSWLRLTLALDGRRADQAEALLEPFHPLSVTVKGAEGPPVLEPAPGESPLWRRCRLEALFEPDLDVAGLRAALAGAGLPAADVDFVDDAGWQDRWRAHAVEFCFGGRLWLVPRDAEAQGQPALHMDPGLAFGSGSHPTTRLCLAWLAGAALAGRRVLDYGCGSGILGLAALKLGCESVLAIDHDPQALLATAENAAYNALADDPVAKVHRLRVGPPGMLGDEVFHVIVANILANPLVELAPVLYRALAPGGVLVMSGMLQHQAGEVMAAYPSLVFDRPEVEADAQGETWACLVGRRRDAPKQ